MASESELGVGVKQLIGSGSNFVMTGRNSFSGNERNHLFINDSKAKNFVDVQLVSALDSQGDARSWAWLDIERDGLLDIALVNANTPSIEIFGNRLRQHADRYIAVRFVGGATPDRTEGWSNRDGYGAIAVAHLGSRKLLREYRAGEGMAAQNAARMMFGLGDAEKVDKLEIRWPSGKTQTVANVSAGTLLTVYEDAAQGPGGKGEKREPYRVEGVEPLDVVAAAKVIPENLIPAADKGVSMLVSMATWCTSCKKKKPELQALREAFPHGELRMYGVPVDDEDETKLASYVEENKPPYHVLAKAERAAVTKFQEMVVSAVGVEVLPSTVIVDARGKVLHAAIGVPTVSEVKKALSSATDDEDAEGETDEEDSAGDAEAAKK